MIKHCLAVLLLAGLVYAGVPRAAAQDTGSSDQQSENSTPPRHHEGRHFDPAKRADMMAKHLNLNDDQKGKVQSILESEQSQMKSLRSDSSLSKQDRRSKMMDIHKSSNDQIRALLNSDQQQKWDSMQKKREERMREHRGDTAPQGQGSDDSQQN